MYEARVLAFCAMAAIAVLGCSESRQDKLARSVEGDQHAGPEPPLVESAPNVSEDSGLHSLASDMPDVERLRRELSVGAVVWDAREALFWATTVREAASALRDPNGAMKTRDLCAMKLIELAGELEDCVRQAQAAANGEATRGARP
jgi:hypothetical protein